MPQRAFGWIYRCKIDGVAIVAVDQVVMHVQIKLIGAGFIGGPATGTAEGRRMKLNGAAGVIIVNMVPANVNMI